MGWNLGWVPRRWAGGTWAGFQGRGSQGLELGLGSKGVGWSQGWVPRAGFPMAGTWAGFQRELAGLPGTWNLDWVPGRWAETRAGIQGDWLEPGLSPRGWAGTWAGFQGLGSQELEPRLGSEGNWLTWLEPGWGSKAMGWNLGWVRRRWARTWAGFQGDWLPGPQMFSCCLPQAVFFRFSPFFPQAALHGHFMRRKVFSVIFLKRPGPASAPTGRRVFSPRPCPGPQAWAPLADLVWPCFGP